MIKSPSEWCKKIENILFSQKSDSMINVKVEFRRGCSGEKSRI